MINIVVSSILSLIATILIGYNSLFLNTTEHIQNQGFINYVSSYPNGIIGLLIGVFCALYFALTPFLLNLPTEIRKKLGQAVFSTEPTSRFGIITDITKSNVGNILTICYSGYAKSFEVRQMAMPDSLVKGDRVLVYYDAENKDKAYLDLLGSVETAKSNQAESIAQSETLFKLLEISPNLTLGQNMYEVMGEIYGDQYDAQKATFSHAFSNEDLPKLIPGRIIPCQINENNNNLSISLVLN